MMNWDRPIDDILRSLAGRHSVFIVILSSINGIEAMHHSLDDSAESSQTLQWAKHHAIVSSETEFSIMAGREDKDGDIHCHILPFQDHLLMLCFRNSRDLGLIRHAAKQACQELLKVLPPDVS